MNHNELSSLCPFCVMGPNTICNHGLPYREHLDGYCESPKHQCQAWVGTCAIIRGPPMPVKGEQI